MFRKLQKLSRRRVALCRGDIPKVREGRRDGVAGLLIVGGGRLADLFFNLLAWHVHGYVIQEYSRACLIAFESLSRTQTGKDGSKPGSSLRFRFTNSGRNSWGSFN